MCRPAGDGDGCRGEATWGRATTRRSRPPLPHAIQGQDPLHGVVVARTLRRSNGNVNGSWMTAERGPVHSPAMTSDAAATHAPLEPNPARPRTFSGIQPSGVVHLGNDLGAIRNYVALAEQYEAIYCIVDYHALTTTHDA